ncbi:MULTISPECIES: cytochrome c family protein [unclassified Anaeromyxobacter]|uniref:cytochrome c family protein n=1 Tax=unclassified Anaeromyxobacter TaxID=2620896 RepID=UPI001F57ED3B|nr:MULTISPECIES: cytochrome c family protein [unclassified Anaeromyxobacter]
MRNSNPAIALAAVIAVAAAPAGAAPSSGPEPRLPDRVTLVYAADVGGYLEPCGCSEDQRGGLARAATVLARIRAEGAPTFFVAGGDLLFELPPDAEAHDQDVLRARTLGAVMRRLGLAAAVAGERDLFLGERFARSTGIPFTEGTVLGGQLGFGSLGKVPSAPVRVAVVHAGGTRAALERADEARRAGLALLLAAHRERLIDDDQDRAVLEAPVPVVQVAGRGQSLARIDLWLRGDLSRPFEVLRGASQRDEELALVAERRAAYADRLARARSAGQAPLAAALEAKLRELDARERELRAAALPEAPPDRPALRVSFVPLTKDIPEDPVVRGMIDAHYREVAAVNLAHARSRGEVCPPPAKGVSSYVGAGASKGACRACHPDAQSHWQTTAHSAAYETLVRVGRQFDLACVRCHVTGWKEPGGACGVAQVAGREAVQCEACHGPASAHVRDPPGHIAREVPATRCRSCHTPEASVRFDLARYRALILGPGHGQPSK